MLDPGLAAPGDEPARPDIPDAGAPDALSQAVLSSLPDITVFAFGSDLRYQLVEGSGFRDLGWVREEIVGRRPTEVLTHNPEDAVALERAMHEALTGQTTVLEIASTRQAGVHWENTVSPLRHLGGEIAGGLIISRNIGRLREAEATRDRSRQEAARWSEAAVKERRLRERLEFLAGIDSLLAGARDRRQVMQVVAAAAVPRLGDWCSVHVFLDPRDREPAVAVGHVDPEMVLAAQRLLERFPYDPEGDFGIPVVIRTGEPVVFTGIDRQELEDAAGGGEGADTVRALDLTSSLIVPIRLGPRVFGALTFSLSGGDRALDQDDLALAQALAGRVATALENRRLGDVERQIADTLQRSLLPARLPEIPGAEVAVRYWAAGEGTQVGGDFYDVFDTGHGSFAVVVGDVCGTGPEAAAVTATARHTIRALARRGDDHASILRQLNDAVLSSWPDIFCTVAYATIEPDERGLVLRAVSAGHPLPIVAPAGDRLWRLGRPGLLIGAFDTPHRHEVEPEPAVVHMHPGDTVVFYTDGAYDLPPPAYLTDDEMLQLVERATAPAHHAEEVADAIAAALEAQVPFEGRDDDVAVVVVRAGQAP